MLNLQAKPSLETKVKRRIKQGKLKTKVYVK